MLKLYHYFIRNKCDEGKIGVPCILSRLSLKLNNNNNNSNNSSHEVLPATLLNGEQSWGGACGLKFLFFSY